MKRFLPLSLLPLVLVACSGDGTTGDLTSSSASSEASSEPLIQETHNVSYEGTLREAGVSIYMQGTHRLELDDGRFVLLESEDIDLGRFLDQQVSVIGSVRPTVEEGGMIMRVEQITVLQVASSSAASEVSSAESSDMTSSTMMTSSSAASAITSSVAAVSSAAPVSSIAASSVAVSSAAAVTTSSVATDVSMDLDARTASMAKANLAAANWTRKYCSTHIGFCFPAHKNWYFKSFGTTTSHLWHVEVSDQEITDLGQGPLVVNLMPGTVASQGAADGEVKTQGNFVVGYKEWTEGRHIEVSAPIALDASVRYILSNLQATPVQ